MHAHKQARTYLRMYTYKSKSFNLLFQLECFIHHYYSLYDLHSSGLCMLMMLYALE